MRRPPPSFGVCPGTVHDCAGWSVVDAAGGVVHTFAILPDSPARAFDQASALSVLLARGGPAAERALRELSVHPG